MLQPEVISEAEARRRLAACYRFIIQSSEQADGAGNVSEARPTPPAVDDRPEGRRRGHDTRAGRPGQVR